MQPSIFSHPSVRFRSSILLIAHKMVRHLPVGGLSLLLALLFLAPSGASAVQLSLTTSNDTLAGNTDDLYTAELGVHFQGQRFSLSLGERLFTDREAGLRFDETHASLAWPVQWRGSWSGQARIEALRVGRGLIGEDVQNAIHSVIGSHEINLRYLATNRHFVGVGLDLERPVAQVSRIHFNLRLNAHSLPGFQHRIQPTLSLSRPLATWLTLSGYAGVQLNKTHLEELDRRVQTFEPTWEVAIAAGKVRLAWNYNSYGTASRHLSLSYRVGTDRRQAKQSST